MYKKSSFPYWFAHWCAFNMTALNLGCWKPRFLFHDWEKPWLLLFLRDYKKVQRIHRKYAKHHHVGKDFDKVDWLGVVVDWECSRFTKPQAQRNARNTMNELHLETRLHVLPILNKLGL